VYIRRFYLKDLPTRKLLNMQKLTKYYFRKDYDIFYFTFEGTGPVEYGLMIGNNYSSKLELDEATFRSLNTDVLATLVKTVYRMQLEENELLPITVFEAQVYESEKIIIAELKFLTSKLADKFVPPDWFGQEIHDDKFDLKLVLGSLVQEEAIDEVASIFEEAIDAEIKRTTRLGSFEERLKKIKNCPKQNQQL